MARLWSSKSSQRPGKPDKSLQGAALGTILAGCGHLPVLCFQRAPCFLGGVGRLALDRGLCRLHMPSAKSNDGDGDALRMSLLTPSRGVCCSCSQHGKLLHFPCQRSLPRDWWSVLQASLRLTSGCCSQGRAGAASFGCPHRHHLQGADLDVPWRCP